MTILCVLMREGHTRAPRGVWIICSSGTYIFLGPRYLRRWYIVWKKQMRASFAVSLKMIGALHGCCCCHVGYPLFLLLYAEDPSSPCSATHLPFLLQNLNHHPPTASRPRTTRSTCLHPFGVEGVLSFLKESRKCPLGFFALFVFLL